MLRCFDGGLCARTPRLALRSPRFHTLAQLPPPLFRSIRLVLFPMEKLRFLASGLTLGETSMGQDKSFGQTSILGEVIGIPGRPTDRSCLAWHDRSERLRM